MYKISAIGFGVEVCVGLNRRLGISIRVIEEPELPGCELRLFLLF